MYFSDQVKRILISQLINDISWVLQKLLKYFNDTIIWTFFSPSFPVWPVICPYLNKALSGSSGTSIMTSSLFIIGIGSAL